MWHSYADRHIEITKFTSTMLNGNIFLPYGKYSLRTYHISHSNLPKIFAIQQTKVSKAKLT